MANHVSLYRETTFQERKKQHRQKVKAMSKKKLALEQNSIDNSFVVNRSSVVLTQSEINILNKGLSFVPTEARPHKRRLIDEFDSFARQLRMKYHMSRRPGSSTQLTEDRSAPSDSNPTSTVRGHGV